MPAFPDKSAKKEAVRYAPFFAFMAMGALSICFQWLPGIEMVMNLRQFMVEMLYFLPLVFMLIGLFDVWVPREAIQKRVGHGSGIAGIMWVVLLAMMQAGPLYVAFPVAYMLSKKGCSNRNVFIYLGAFSAMKFPMVTFEIGFMGLRFSLTRLIFTLPVFILIGVIMEKLMGKGYELMEIETEQ